MPERIEVVVAGRDKASGWHDVIVMDPDAVIDDRCIDKFRRCAASDARIGAVVPWSPQTLAPDGGDLRLANAALDRAAPRAYPDFEDERAPCIFVRGGVLREIGGAETLRDRAALHERVRAAGYRSVLCDDAFAGRSGLEARSRGAPRAVAPIARLARTQIAIGTQPDKPGILHVLHPRGGGTEKYVQSIVRASRDRYRHYFLRVALDRWLFKDAEGEHRAACQWPRDVVSEDCLRIMAAWLAIDFVHVHSLVGSGDDLVRMIASTGLPYGYSVHDMYAPCPTVYLIGATGAYCEATTDPGACGSCLAQLPQFHGVDITQWRARYAVFLRGAAKVWAPSNWAGATLRKYYPDSNVEIRPHPADGPRMARRDIDAFALPDDRVRHVAVLGAIGPEKGARKIDALADEIRARGLPLRIVVVGFTDRARRWQSDDRTLTIHGSYGEDELAALFERYRIDVVLFPTLWPETFSYTLSEAWRAGRPALVPPRGALAERVEATGAGWLMRGWPAIDAIADQLVEITSGGRAADLAVKVRCAHAAAQAEASMAEPAPYERIVHPGVRTEPGAATRHAIYAAACRAMSVDPLPMPAAREPATPSALDRLLRFVSRA